MVCSLNGYSQEENIDNVAFLVLCYCTRPQKGAQGLASQVWRTTTRQDHGDAWTGSMAHAGRPAMEGLHGLGGGLSSGVQIGDEAAKLEARRPAPAGQADV